MMSLSDRYVDFCRLSSLPAREKVLTRDIKSADFLSAPFGHTEFGIGVTTKLPGEIKVMGSR